MRSHRVAPSCSSMSFSSRKIPNQINRQPTETLTIQGWNQGISLRGLSRSVSDADSFPALEVENFIGASRSSVSSDSLVTPSALFASGDLAGCDLGDAEAFLGKDLVNLRLKVISTLS